MPKKAHPIDAFIKEAIDFTSPSAESQQRYTEYRGRRAGELDQWHKAKGSGWHEQHIGPLLKSLEPLIQSEVNKRLPGLGGSVSRAALKSELTNSALKSIKSYNPEAGTALSTHVTGGFPRINDFLNAVRNAKYVPGDDMKRYDRFRNAHAEMHDELGRPPTAEELQSKLPWKPKAIEKMMKSFGAEAYTDMGDNLSPNDEAALMTPRDAFHSVYSQLKPQEQQFGQHYYPPEGETPPSVQNVAKALGIPSHKAYRLRSRLQGLMSPYLKRQ